MKFKLGKVQNLLLVAVLAAETLAAQSEHFPLKREESQYKMIQQVIGLDTVTLEFSRPNLKGRELFGEMLPWDEVWRTGANASTKISFSEQMFLNGHRIPRGTYSLYSVPRKENKWTVILNKNTSLWGHYGYDEEQDFLRLDIEPLIQEEFRETFDIVFTNTTKDSSTVSIVWGKLVIPLKIEIDKELTDQRIMSSIKQKLNDPKAHEEPIVSAHIYFFAANYYYNSNRNTEQALEWMNKAIEIKEVNYFFYYKAEIAGSSGSFTEALKASRKGLSLFEDGGNEEWKWRYRTQIDKWERELQKE